LTYRKRDPVSGIKKREKSPFGRFYVIIKLNLFVMENNFEIIVRAVIQKDNKILACKNIKKNDNYYYLPGGHVEMGEPADKALVRELKEELNLSVEDTSFIGVIENAYNQENEIHHEINLIFNIRANNVEDKSNEDHLGFFFFSKNQFSRKTILPKTLKEAIIQWQKDGLIFWKSNINIKYGC